MLRTESPQPHAKISASFNKEALSIVCVRPRVCSFQSDQFRRISRSVSVNSQARRSFVGFDVWGGLLQDQRWKKKKTRANSFLFEEEVNYSKTTTTNNESQVKKEEISLYRGFLVGAVFLILLLVMPPEPLPMTFENATYSDFLSKIDNDKVQKVEVDGDRIRYMLKEIEMKVGRGALWSMAPAEQTIFRTRRPKDKQSPYQKMVEKGVEFGSRDKLWDDDINFMGMCVSFLGLSIVLYVCGGIYRSLPESISENFLKEFQKRFQKEFRHIFSLPKSLKSKQGEAVTFADVGGIDEDKKELKEIMGIEENKKLLGSEKAVVARHEAGHAIVGTAVAKFLSRHPRVENLSILPRSGEASGFTYTPPTNEDMHLFFIRELLGGLVTLLGGRAAEEFFYSGYVSAGGLDDIRRASDMVYKAVNKNTGLMLSGGKLDVSGGGASWGSDQGHLVDRVEEEVKSILRAALEAALSVVRANSTVLEGLGAHLEGKEKVEGEELQSWLKLVVAPQELSIFINSNQERLIPSPITSSL